MGVARRKPEACSRGHAFAKSSARPVCPKCWPGYYRKKECGTRFAALLRGINVGGKNIIPMAKLRAAFEAMGFAEVSNYIQSGNVLFSAAGSAKALVRRIEATLSARFSYRSRVVLVPEKDLAGVVKRAPKGFGGSPSLYRYDVIFLRAPLTSAAAAKAFQPKDGVDAVWPGKGVVYFSRLIARASQSRMSRITQSPLYQDMTIRNWNTTTKLLALLRQSTS